MKKRFLVFFLLIGLWLNACVEPFELDVVSEIEILTVDAKLTDLPEPQFFTITTSVNNKGNAYSVPLEKLKAKVQINGTETIALTEQKPGVYYFPASFTTKAGNTYQLFFEKPDGTQYESLVEAMPLAPEISNVHNEFEPKGVVDFEGAQQPAHYVYIDTNDPGETQNNYIWTYKHYERQYFCASCYESRYYLKPTPGCYPDPFYTNTKRRTDYACDGKCWDIFYNPQLEVMSDVFFNGKAVINKLIAKVPYYSVEGCLVEISQQCVSGNAYHYIKLLSDLTQHTGTLVDTPPAAIIGNIKNLKNPEEKIAGFFMVSSIRKSLYWLDRKNATTAPISFGLLGHQPIYEPSSIPPDPPRPPLALCIESRYRTPKQPAGWRNE